MLSHCMWQMVHSFELTSPCTPVAQSVYYVMLCRPGSGSTLKNVEGGSPDHDIVGYTATPGINMSPNAGKRFVESCEVVLPTSGEHGQVLYDFCRLSLSTLLNFDHVNIVFHFYLFVYAVVC